jgi:hypothetical protein
VTTPVPSTIESKEKTKKVLVGGRKEHTEKAYKECYSSARLLRYYIRHTKEYPSPIVEIHEYLKEKGYAHPH